MRHHPAAATALACGLATLATAPAQAVVPAGFTVDTLMATGLTAPNDFCFLPDGRVLIANGPGQVTIFANGASALAGTVPGIQNLAEAGLLSICADPGFATNGYVYVWYTNLASPYQRRLDRFTCTGDLADPASTRVSFATSSRRVVLDLDLTVTFATLHNGGSLRFGTDGCLYFSHGETGTLCAAPDVTSVKGKLLRMHVGNLPPGGSTVPPSPSQLDPGDNPLSAANDRSQLVIAAGLRNPFRMEIDPATGNLYIGDVGGTQQEECNEYVRGQGPPPLVNFGWPWREGLVGFAHPSITCTQVAGLTEPIMDLPQTDGWVAVICGPLYRNRGGRSDFGGSHEGSLFVADHYDGRILRLARREGTWELAPPVAGQPAPDRWALGFLGVTSLQTGRDGAIWLTQYDGIHNWTSGGFLRRIRPASGDRVVAVAGAGQVAPAEEPFPVPLIVRAQDAGGAPLVGAPVSFAVDGAATLSTVNPVLTDAGGFARTVATATEGGAFTVTGALANTPHDAVFELFARGIDVATAPASVTLTVRNRSAAASPIVPMVLLASLPGIAPLPTPIGPVCTTPFHPWTVVLEDGFGLFGFVSLSGGGGIGTPGFTRTYPVPPAVLAGLTLQIQAVGLDPVAGPFRTNCERKTF